MAGRNLKSSSGRLYVPASLAALLALASAGTAIASSGLVPCDDAITRSQELAATELHAANVNHEIDATVLAATPLVPANYPEAEAQAETALLPDYDESAAASSDESGPLERSENEDGKQPQIKARVPGMSDSDLARYKRNMYRRDI